MDLREAKCCQVFYDTNYRKSNRPPVDPDDVHQKLHFDSLKTVGNNHLVLEQLKNIHCRKCNRSGPGFADLNDIQIRIDGKFERLTDSNYLDLSNAIKNSETIKATDLKVSSKFVGTAEHSVEGKNIECICTKCEKYYEVNDQNSVVPIYNESNDDDDSQSSQSSVRDVGEKINKWSEENLFSLNLQSNEDYKTFMSKLTKIEKMVITPMLLNIMIYRCHGSGVPASHHGTIAYPLKSPMETNSLPWYDFENLPFIIVYRREKNEKYNMEAKIDLRKIEMAWQWMTKRIKFKGQDRSLNRLVDEFFIQFTGENMRKLKERLDGHDVGVPRGLREHIVSEDAEKLTETISKDFLKTWLKSTLLFAQTVRSAFIQELDEENLAEKVDPYDLFWDKLEGYSMKYLQNKILNSTDRVEIDNYKKWIEEGTVVTILTLRKYTESKGYLNKVDKLESYDKSYHIFDEFLILKQRFSNDLGQGCVDIGGTVQSAEEHPDTIIDRNLKNTALDRRPIEPDLANPAPEWTASYLQKIFLNVFLTGDAAYDQQRSVPLSNANVQDDSRCKEEYIKTLSQQKDAQQLPELLVYASESIEKIGRTESSQDYAEGG